MKSLAAAAVLLCSLFAVSSHAAEKDAPKDKKAATPINKKCPVEHGDVDPEVTIQHEGKTIGFCCAGCDEEFKKDPAKYMAVIAKEEAAAKDAEKDKSKDKKDANKKDEPKKEAELNTKCPVTGDDADKTLTSEYKGRTIAFCCEDCVKDFKKDPKKYIAKLDEEKSRKSGEKKQDDAEREKDGKNEKK
jgi:YHS domain-containing protein